MAEAQQPSQGFYALDPRIQRFIWQEKWEELRDIQEFAINEITSGEKRDIIIAAPTATGKTEAAFLPILTELLKTAPLDGLAIYISPLKALINDQFRRLTTLAESLEVPVWPWHGDVGVGTKRKFAKNPVGILLITPEALEATLCNRGTEVRGLYKGLRFIVVDELHAFIGSERGKQLQSLMHRIDKLLGHTTPRIGLSATLGDMRLAAEFLRSAKDPAETKIIESASEGGALKMRLKGYELKRVVKGLAPSSDNAKAAPDEAPVKGSEVEEDEKPGADLMVHVAIAKDIYESARGTNNLIFPNSKSDVEHYAYTLRRLCEQDGIPNQFWPHHGSLSAEIRKDTEAALLRKDVPASAVCTNTLELGVDIGAVRAVYQVGSPPTVASLRQRLGRSGRRAGESSILRGYLVETEIDDKTGVHDSLRLNTVKFTAMVSLLVEGWCEPPRIDGLHASTLVQQLLSLISERGGIGARIAFAILCRQGPFNNITAAQFADLLRNLGKRELIEQDTSDPSQTLLLGRIGEAMVSHYSFYAAFAEVEEYRVMFKGKQLGSIPVDNAMAVGDLLIFAAKTWQITALEAESKTLFVSPHNAGTPPKSPSGTRFTHAKVRQRMREIYEGKHSEIIARLLSPTAQTFIDEGRRAYKEFRLHRQNVVRIGASMAIFPWTGDGGVAVLAMMLRKIGLTPACYGGAIIIDDADYELESLIGQLMKLGREPPPTIEWLLEGCENLGIEKWDWALPPQLLQRSFASKQLDIEEAHQWLSDFSSRSASSESGDMGPEQ